MAQLGKVLAEAQDIIAGPRREAYGDAYDSFKEVAALWSMVFKVEITPYQVALAMVALKFQRECNKHSYDNLLDLAGYTGLAEYCQAKSVNSKENETCWACEHSSLEENEAPCNTCTYDPQANTYSNFKDYQDFNDEE